MNRYLAVCQEQLRLLDRLVEQILSLSMERKKSLLLNMEYVSVRELVESLVATFISSIRPKRVSHLKLRKA